MKERKPRTKEQPWYYKEKCPYDDGTKDKECNRPWAHLCDGNIHKCVKLKYQHLASLSDKKRDLYINNEKY